VHEMIFKSAISGGRLYNLLLVFH